MRDCTAIGCLILLECDGGISLCVLVGVRFLVGVGCLILLECDGGISLCVLVGVRFLGWGVGGFGGIYECQLDGN